MPTHFIIRRKKSTKPTRQYPETNILLSTCRQQVKFRQLCLFFLAEAIEIG